MWVHSLVFNQNRMPVFTEKDLMANVALDSTVCAETRLQFLVLFHRGLRFSELRVNCVTHELMNEQKRHWICHMYVLTYIQKPNNEGLCWNGHTKTRGSSCSREQYEN